MSISEEVNTNLNLKLLLTPFIIMFSIKIILLATVATNLKKSRNLETPIGDVMDTIFDDSGVISPPLEERIMIGMSVEHSLDQFWTVMRKGRAGAGCGSIVAGSLTVTLLAVAILGLMALH